MTRGSTRYSLAGVAVGDESPVRIMGVLNVSPESFYAGSVRSGAADIAAAACRMEEEGADFIDIGAMSTAPYRNTAISAEEECARMKVAVDAATGAVGVPVSADTSRAAVAAAALMAGARIVNDVRGLRGVGMAEVARRAEGVVLMASPVGDIGRDSSGATPGERVRADLLRALERAAAAAIAGELIVVDPGIGFYTRGSGPSAVDFNCAILAGMSDLAGLGPPVLVGISRKAFIGAITGRDSVDDRLPGTLAATAVAVMEGASVVRTHDVAQTRDAIRVVEAIRKRR